MGKIVVITGAAGGIGLACAAAFRALGWRCVLVTRQRERFAAQGAAAIDDLVVEADVSLAGGGTEVIRQALAHFGQAPQALAHLAGSTLIAPLHRTTGDQYAAILRANLDSAFFMLQAFVEALRTDAKPGAAVLMSSVVARVGTANHEAIAAAKGGVEALVRSAAATYAGAGIRVNGVAPGMTDTPLAAGILRSDAMREAAGKQYPLGGITSADEVAQVVAFLLSDAASRITGQILPVDGGFTAIRPLVR